MVISIASGKGGTGKTTVVTNLAKVINNNVIVLDCDVEEPNSHLFLKPVFNDTEEVTLPVPEVDISKCSFCGECGKICQFSAIAPLGKDVLIFPELCHGCGGCTLACPEEAIKEIPRKIGEKEKGRSDSIEFVHGKLEIGEVVVPHLIKSVKECMFNQSTAIIDCPPGTSCPVIESVKDSDYCILVTEPTPFGLNDLKLAVEMLKILKIPFGIIINRADAGDNEVFEYCKEEKLNILMQIPMDREIAICYSEGKLIVDEMKNYHSEFSKLWNTVKSIIK